MNCRRNICILGSMIGFSFILLRCGNRCIIDHDFKDYFESAIASLEYSYYGEGIKMKPITVENARFFLELVTKEKSLIHRSSLGSFYENEEIFKKEVNNWRIWFQKNKCDFEISDVDEFYAAYLKKQEDKQDSLKPFKFPNNWRLLFSNEGWGIPDLESRYMYTDTIW
jgi:hypothetical protein